MPYQTPHMACTWNQTTPRNFLFHIKAYGALTGHAISPKTLPKDIRLKLPGHDLDRHSICIRDKGIMSEIITCFKTFLKPLQESDKLGILLFQYPPSLRYSTRNMNLIARTALRF